MRRREFLTCLGGAAAWPLVANAQTRRLTFNADLIEDLQRDDGSLRLRIPLTGSLQNPAWSPDGRTILFTRFRDGYNRGPADLFLCDLVANKLTALLEDGAGNISQPGSTWNARTGRIVFSSTRDDRHDEIYSMSPTPGRLQVEQLTARDALKAYEPSMAPDGRAIVFETHGRGDRRGRLTTMRLGAPDSYLDLTQPADDCRQPNWSPAGNLIVYQKRIDDQWDIWLCDLAKGQHRKLTEDDGDKTDATFSPDGRFVLYSGESDSDDDGVDGDNLYALPVGGGKPTPVTRYSGYHGASSWSPDGTTVALEAAPEPPKGSAGTVLHLTPVPKALAQPRR